MAEAFQCDDCGDLFSAVPFGYVEAGRRETGGAPLDLCEECYNVISRLLGERRMLDMSSGAL